jgi:GT2 family glycosyltransferase
VKLYEYLSQGKPVVATNMAELAQCRDVVYIAENHCDFIDKLDLALAEDGPERRDRRVRFASANTWHARYKTLHDVMIDAASPVSILVVSHNSAEFLQCCLDSILANTLHPCFEIIAVDNASSDDSPDILRRYADCDNRVHAICLSENTGFAAANNLAADQATGTVLVFLNADTMVTPGWLHRLLFHLREDSTIGLVLPVTNWAGNEAKITVTYKDKASMHAFARTLAEEKAGTRSEIQTGPLFCAAIPVSAWKKVGPLDESFKVGMFEDDDYSLRVWNAGYRVVTAEDCFVHHFGQGSFNQLAPETYRQVFEQNRRRFEDKWHTCWRPHHYRPGVGAESGRFTPEEFLDEDAKTTA